eukprot:635254-Prymnesium_polylepis.1
MVAVDVELAEAQPIRSPNFLDEGPTILGDVREEQSGWVTKLVAAGGAHRSRHTIPHDPGLLPRAAVGRLVASHDCGSGASLGRHFGWCRGRRSLRRWTTATARGSRCLPHDALPLC